MNIELNQANYKVDPNRWLSTLPNYEQNLSNPYKKYSLIIILFVVGLILVSVIKNETRNLQKEISNLRASINILKLDLHKTTLDYNVITSPENISRLAKEHLEFDYVSYKKSQIKQLDKKMESLAKLEEKKYKKVIKEKSKDLTNKVKLQVAKRIETKKVELRKLQELYSSPKKLPKELKAQVAKKIEKTKTELKDLYTSPKESIDLGKVRKWAVVQVVKVFLGMPIIPGK